VKQERSNLLAIALGTGKSAALQQRLFIFLIAFFLQVPSAGSFAIPEKLDFDLRWMGIKAGTASLELQDNRDTFQIISTAYSADWVSVFYRVEDRIESTLSKGQSDLFIGLPAKYRVKIREGRHRRNKEVIYEQEIHKATLIDHREGKTKVFDIRPDTLDPLSGFYYVRTKNLEAGKSVFMDMFDSKKMWNVEVKVLKKEKIMTKFGEIDTIVIKPLMQSEGIFNRKGEMQIWLTDDDKHIPVKMKVKVAIGSITATLVGGTY
jgi:hypothetical protein